MKTLLRGARVGLVHGSARLLSTVRAIGIRGGRYPMRSDKLRKTETLRRKNSLGVLYVKGEGVEQDAKEAVRWFRRGRQAGPCRLTV